MLGLRFLALGAALGLASIATHVDAHHSTAIYDSDNPIELAGTVVEWQFVNPHVFILLEVVDGYSRDIPKALEGVTDPLKRLRRIEVKTTRRGSPSKIRRAVLIK